ncbi:bifunctional diaminohydroxyphosphoribosylaminopyrimidine deaminase/5-amino-6-(5-phosphoribosylamino)uracil reductase RibD [uncultured Draconibacterium sp.]|uniref:bifunctional diaminohydroxyphosphoribosylaminopyrimidine deaminase/5-amino-6-(5-phosphoribosylamino)uracil reductase RibD n=1 Tax=uncultured Draconibacterium sp. TaxID=1573823 RepID=UPI0025D5014A|nr:bifunctional diaminohydroxyphosphoribosylaminopyrimidine deaminase/5-amino-6-(5-phosphoribosylamino)uracil reductase RibD [uncultured Draconibacterium sp.]
MTTDEKYMARCIQLAKKGSGAVSPNPMVGCVIVYQGQVIGEGYHQKYGQAHAEVNAINAVDNPEQLKSSTIYVSLEPCAHFGLTPPCSDLIIRKQIPKVVIGSIDPFAEVAGKGIEKLRKAGLEVKTGVLKKECDELNRRFFTFHRKKRPYILLKWAQTTDGFIDIDRKEETYGEPTWITGSEALLSVHKMRAAEDAILVGTNTAEKDNPSLTVRHCSGKNPLRIVIDRNLRLEKTLHLFDNASDTLIINGIKNRVEEKTSYVKIDFSENILPQLMNVLHQKNVLSLIVEGGRQLLNSFITEDLWDEAHIYTGNKTFGRGIKAPEINHLQGVRSQLGNDTLLLVSNATNKK